MRKSPKISSLIDKAIFDYNLVEKNDRILIGASGGKDSTVLIEYFANRKKRPDSDFEYKALHIQTDFASPFPEKIKDFFAELSVPFETLNVNVLERIKPNQKMSCYWCSTQRRTELINYAIKNGYNKIALGHHLDDVLETFLMNMLNKSEISTMIPKLKYQKYPIEIIRPLYYVEEKNIIEYAKQKEFFGYTCTCSYQENSTRKSARKLLEEITNSQSLKKQNMLSALKNVRLEYLP